MMYACNGIRFPCKCLVKLLPLALINQRPKLSHDLKIWNLSHFAFAKLKKPR